MLGHYIHNTCSTRMLFDNNERYSHYLGCSSGHRMIEADQSFWWTWFSSLIDCPYSFGQCVLFSIILYLRSPYISHTMFWGKMNVL
ncbi:hypothetical protein RND71_019417 [Anisodus tanguticus]|uniref:Uncharacterized protein n=1 Tax=Anisodus tanguticus TaxID=243964 RepID=A0AAE1RZB2_9SOLA|nr:hypothetical protein RND71_019417 [Anisodus tanguticus]